MLRYVLILCTLVFANTAFAQDTCDFALDNECDELRFGGQGYCDDGTDTTDCTLVSRGISDDSCTFANDGECDEYRYNGTGACQDGSDTNDCAVWQAQRESDFMDRARALGLDSGTIAGLGNNTCRWNNDGECDDESLGGTGACAMGTDASDCLTLIDGSAAAGAATGDNSCLYANDNECDETRFGGSGYCEDGTDASDCGANISALPTGDNSCAYANDNECDEARFGGGGYCDDGTDTNDCTGTTQPVVATGPDSCEYANDNECDEARYGGGDYCDIGTDTTDCRLLASNVNDDSCQTAANGQCDELRYGGTGLCVDGSDATDCGAVSAPSSNLEALLALVPEDLRAQLGDDSCEHANDLECDDDDFGGTGACDEGTDASDCRALAVGGDNSCRFANDNECDEPIEGGTRSCISGSDTNDCRDIRVFVDRTDTCNTAFDGICNEADGGDGTCVALSDSADCIGRSRPASLTNHFFGRDDRLLVDNSQMPWRAIGSIDQSCTGTLVGPALVLTAAHCLYGENGFSEPEIFYAGQSRGENFGVAKVTNAFHDPDYDNNAAPGEGIGTDWALLELDRNLGDDVGMLDIHVLTATDLSQIGRAGLLVNQAGYSWDTGNNMSGNIGCRVTDALELSAITHQCDTAYGDSGSPFLLNVDGEWRIIAVDSEFFSQEDSKAPFADGNRAVDSRAFAAAVAANQ